MVILLKILKRVQNIQNSFPYLGNPTIVNLFSTTNGRKERATNNYLLKGGREGSNAKSLFTFVDGGDR